MSEAENFPEKSKKHFKTLICRWQHVRDLADSRNSSLKVQKIK